MANHESDRNPRLDRRALLGSLLAAPAAGIPLLAACTTQPSGDAAPGAPGLAAATMGLISSTVCTLMPETSEGPYYLDPKLVRRDITEGRAGIALRLHLQVVTADCQPVPNARVDIWQCDAQGDYSGYASMGSERSNDTTGQTFLRGTQHTDRHGIASFDSIYPGWYRGRTAHIHYKVFLAENTVLTSQIFFPDALSEYVYLKAPAYARAQERDTLNRIDDIATQAGQGAYCAIREQADRYIAALVVGIDPAARWQEGGQGMRGGPPPGDGRPPPPGFDGSRPPGPPPGGPGGPGPRGRRDADTPIFPGDWTG